MTEQTQEGVAAGRTPWRKIYWGAALILLLLPLIAMQFTDEVVWGIEDFVVFGTMLGIAGLLGEAAARTSSNTAYRAAFGVAIAASFLLVWVNLAVGTIGNEGNPANLMYLGVIAIAFIGAVVARRDPRALSRTMFGVAGAQALVAVIAISMGWGDTTENWPKDILGVTVVFVMLWVASALLFREAMDRQVESEPEENTELQ